MPASPAPLRRVDALRGLDGAARRPDAPAHPARAREAGALGARAPRGARGAAVHRLPPPQGPRRAAGGSCPGAREPRASTAGPRRSTRGAAAVAARARRDRRWPVLRQDADRLAAVEGAPATERSASSPAPPAPGTGCAPRCTAARSAAEALLALLPPEWTVADLGCGTGAVAAELARASGRSSPSTSRRRCSARRAAGSRAWTNVEIHEARLEALPLADGSCDAALAVLVLSYLEDPAAALREAARILRPGGRLVVVEAARHGDEDLRRRMGQRSPGFDAAALAGLFPAGRRAPVVPDRPARARREGARARRRPRGAPRRAAASVTAPKPPKETEDGRHDPEEEEGSAREGAAARGADPQARAPGEGPLARRVGAQGDRARREGDARAHGHPARVRREAAARGPAHHRLAPHDDPDRGPHRDAERARAPTSAGRAATSSRPRTTPRRRWRSARTARPRARAASRSSPGRARRSRSTGSAPSARSTSAAARARPRSWTTAATRPCSSTRASSSSRRARSRPPATADSEEYAVVLKLLARELREGPEALDAGREGLRGRHRGDHHRRAPALRDAEGGHAPLPRHQRERLGHEVEVRQPVRLPPLARRRAQPRDRRDARRQALRRVRLRRRGQGVRAGAPRAGRARGRHRDRPDQRAPGDDGGVPGRPRSRTWSRRRTSSSPRPATSTSSPSTTCGG